MGSIARTDERRPNVVIFLADDFGFGCLNANGADKALIRTPNLNRLAKEGLNFTNAYTTGSVCSPTRYALLTGRYSWRTRLKRGVINSFDGFLIDLDTSTLASYLKQQGYQTAHVGKWHLGYKLGRDKNLLGDLSPGPNDVGFDYHFGVPNNQDDVHKIYVENNRIYGLRSNDLSPYGRSFYGRPYVGYDAPQRVTTEVGDTLTEKAIRWIRQRDRERPFFLYFASTSIHHPISPSERMRGTSDAGAYGDFIHDTDYAVGQLMQSLEAIGELDNTIFVFTADNGSDLPSDEMRPEVQALNRGLAVNGSFRGDKHTIYDGGFRVPFLVRWPNGIVGGSERSGLVSTVDLFATIVDIVMGEAPAPEAGAPDSFSFKEAITERPEKEGRPHLVLRDVQGRKAVVFGEWKYVSDQIPESSPQFGKVTLDEELYHLSNDPSETHNRAMENPEVLQRGKELLERIESIPESRNIDL